MSTFLDSDQVSFLTSPFNCKGTSLKTTISNHEMSVCEFPLPFIDSSSYCPFPGGIVLEVRSITKDRIADI